MMGTMKAKLLDTNSVQAKKYIGDVVVCKKLDSDQLLIVTKDGCHILTNKIENIYQDNAMVVVKTKNYIYELGVMEVSLND